jgi:hypothetical protein
MRLAEGTNAHLGFFQPDAVMATWLNRIQADEDNLQAGLEWSELWVDAGERGSRLAAALHWVWFVRGRSAKDVGGWSVCSSAAMLHQECAREHSWGSGRATSLVHLRCSRNLSTLVRPACWTITVWVRPPGVC